MSVKLVYDVPRSEFRFLQQLGGFCYCRRRAYGSSLIAQQCYLNAFKTLIDITPKTLEGKPTKDDPIVVRVNFGLVPVETTSHQDFVVYSSKGKPIHNLFLEAKDRSVLFDNAFRAALPAQPILPELLHDSECQSPHQGRKKLKFRIYFEPELGYMHYADSLYVWVDEEIPIRIDCQGIGEGPSVCFSENLLNFGGQYYREEGKMRFKMNNKSGADAKFQFENDNTRSVFKVCPTSGIVPANAELTVEVTFQAPKPQTYYKRIICLIHHQHTQYLDLIGICIPRPFFSISEIDFGLSTAETQLLPIPTENNIEYFHSGAYWGIEFDQDIIDFGFRDLSLAPEDSVVLTVSNFLPYDVVIEWVSDPTKIFNISPQMTVIQSEQSVPFDVSFHPSFPETFYYGELDCYIYPTGYLWPEEHGGAPWIVSRKQILPIPTPAETGTMVNPTPVDSGAGSRVSSPPLIVLQEGNLNSKTGSEEELLGEAFSRTTTASNKKQHDLQLTKSRSRTHHLAPVSRPSAHKHVHHGGPKHKDNKKHPEHKDKKLGRKKHELHKDADSSESKPETSLTLPNPKTVPSNTPATEEAESPTPAVSEKALANITSSKSVAKILSRRFPPESEPAIGTGNTVVKNKVDFPLNLILRNYGTFCIESKQLEPIDVKSIMETVMEVNVPIEPAINELVEIPIQPAEEVNEETMEEEVTSKAEGEDETAEEEECTKEVPTRAMPQELALPLCMTLKVTGHTTVKYSPVLHFKIPSKITMPPTWPKQDTCRTMILKNDNDMPVYYDISQPEGENNAFTLKPTKGMIPGKFHQIILVNMKSDSMDPEFCKSDPSACAQTATALLNFHDSNIIDMRGFSCLPTLEMVLCYDSNICDFNLVFPETIIGNVVETEMELRNPTRFHYRFALIAPKPTPDEIPAFNGLDGMGRPSIFTASPAFGMVSPYEVVRIKWTFNPFKIKEYFSIWKIHFLCMKNKYVDFTTCPAYSANIPLIGLARECKIEATPNKVSFDLVELFTPKEEIITVRNICNTPVKVKLKLVHDEWLEYFPKHQARIKPRKFLLDGLESIEVKIIIRPDSVKIQDFTIEYMVEPVKGDLNLNSTETMNTIPLFDEFHKLCQFSFIGDHASIKVTDVLMTARHPIWDAGQAWSMFSLARFNELLTPMKNCLKECVPPKIPTVTFRFPPAPLHSESAIFTLLLSNSGTLQAHWKVYTEPPAELPPYFQPKNLTPNFDGNVREDKRFLASIWANRMIGKYKKRIERPTTPSSAILTKPTGCAHIKPFRDFKLFKVSPKRGTMDSGTDTLISFRYSYKEIGKHKLTVLIRVYPSIFTWITLKGTTLEPGTSFVQHMHKDECPLVPVALSDLDPPIQSFWMYNGGNADAPYEVDQKPFLESRDESFGHQVWDCLNKSGVIPPRSWTPIRIRFSPFEIKEYKIPLNVSTNGNHVTSIMLKGSPLLDPMKLLRPAELCGLEIPDQKISLIDPLVPMILTPSRISFPHLIPTGQKSSSLVFITNISDTNEISFSWPLVQLDGGGSIKFVPDSGILKPRTEQPCMIVVEGGRVSMTFSRMIRCSMIDETARAQYQYDKKSWYTCKSHYMKVEGLSETDANVKLLKKFGSKPVEPLSFSRIVCVSVYISSVLGMLDHSTAKEQERVIAIPRCKPLATTDSDEKLVHISPFTRELSKELMSNLIWDLITSDGLPIQLDPAYEKRKQKATIKPSIPKITSVIQLSSPSLGLGVGSRSKARSIWPEHYEYGAGTGARVPIYFDYKLVEQQDNKHPQMLGMQDLLALALQQQQQSPIGTTESDETVHELILPGTGTQDVISNVLMNLMQEYSTEFEPGTTLPSALNPVAPKEIINTKKYPYYFI